MSNSISENWLPASEREVKRWRRLTLLSIVLAGGAVLLSTAQVVMVPTGAQSLSHLGLNHLVIQTSEGKAVGRLGVMRNAGSLALMTKDNILRGIMIAGEGEPSQIMLVAADQSQRAVLSVSEEPHGHSELEFYDSNGVCRLALGIDKAGNPYFAMKDEDGQPVVGMGVLKDGLPRLRLSGDSQALELGIGEGLSYVVLQDGDRVGAYGSQGFKGGQVQDGDGASPQSE